MAFMLDGLTGACETPGMAILTWTIGDVSKKLRDVIGWKATHLSEHSDVDTSTVSRFENDGNFTHATLDKIAKAFGMSSSELMSLVPPPGALPRDLPSQAGGVSFGTDGRGGREVVPAPAGRVSPERSEATSDKKTPASHRGGHHLVESHPQPEARHVKRTIELFNHAVGKSGKKAAPAGKHVPKHGAGSGKRS
jgi:transcriptional regulator with XRE-family HTH domain